MAGVASDHLYSV